MNKKITVGIAASFIFLAVAVTFVATMIYAMNLFDRKIVSVQERVAMYDRISEIDSAIRHNYCGPIDDDAIRDGMARGYLSAIEDEDTVYVTKRQIAEDAEKMSGVSTGIGVYTEMNASGYAVITEVVPDSPADKIGLLPGDTVTAVNDEQALALGYDAVVRAMYGTEGDQLKLSYTREATDYTVELVYDKFTRSSITAGLVNDNYFYIRFDDFNDLTLSEFQRQLADAAEAGTAYDAFIFDLRGLKGGYDVEAVASLLCELMPQGAIVSARYGNRDVGMLYENGSNGSYAGTRAAVLVNGETSGLAELFAACLSMRDNVSVIGTVTAGKGKLQKLFTLADGSGVYVSFCSMMACGSFEFDGTGVAPDFITDAAPDYVLPDGIPSVVEDTQLRKAVEVLEAGS